MPAEGYRKISKAKCAEYLRLVGDELMLDCAAAREIGVAPRTVRNLCKENSEFAGAVEEARECREQERCERVEEALYMAAESGNIPAVFGYLYSRWPERWQDKRRHEVTGKDGGPIKHDLDFSHLSDEELERAILREAEGIAGGVTAEAQQMGAASTDGEAEGVS